MLCMEIAKLRTTTHNLPVANVWTQKVSGGLDRTWVTIIGKRLVLMINMLEEYEDTPSGMT